MEATEFIRKEFKVGDPVTVTLVFGNRKVNCFFGGYQTFRKEVNPRIDYAVYPVFYAAGKKGQMVKRAAPEIGTTTPGWSSIKSVKLTQTKWLWLGKYTGDDAKTLYMRDPDTVVKCMKENFGSFEDQKDLQVTLNNMQRDNSSRTTSDMKYIVGYVSDKFIAIYEKIS